jgi:hypothetical protein
MRRFFLVLAAAQLLFEAATNAQPIESDVFPLAIGNMWTYHFMSTQTNNDAFLVVRDTGLVHYRIVNMFTDADSTRWLVREIRDLTRHVAVQFNSTDSVLIDSSLFEIVETPSGRHRLHRNSPLDSIWFSVFPWGVDLTDTSTVNRYAPLDSTGKFVFTSRPPGPYYAYSFQFVFTGGVGETQVQCLSGNLTNQLVCESNHTLLSSVINSIQRGPSDLVPDAVSLDQNYPNPFNPHTRIEYSLAATDHVSLQVYSVTGQLVATLQNGPCSTGRHVVEWDASNLPSGEYFYRLETDHSKLVRKAVLLK